MTQRLVNKTQVIVVLVFFAQQGAVRGGRCECDAPPCGSASVSPACCQIGAPPSVCAQKRPKQTCFAISTQLQGCQISIEENWLHSRRQHVKLHIAPQFVEKYFTCLRPVHDSDQTLQTYGASSMTALQAGTC